MAEPSALDQYLNKSVIKRSRGIQGVVSSAVTNAADTIDSGVLNPELLKQTRDQINTLDPEAAQRERLKYSYAAKEVGGLKSAINQVQSQAKASGNTALDEYLSTKKKEPGVLQQVIAPIQKGLEYVDNVTSRPVRALTYPGESWFDWEKAKDSRQWNKALRASDNPLAKGFVGITNAAGSPLTTLAGPALASIGAVSDLVGHKDLSTTVKNITDTLHKSQDSVGDFVRDSSADWTLPLSFGLKGGATTAANAVLRTATKAGWAPATAEKFSQMIHAVVSTPLLNEAEKALRVNSLLDSVKLPRIFGQTAEHLNKGQLAISADIPGQIIKYLGEAASSPAIAKVGKALQEGVEVLPAITGKEFTGAKLLDKLPGVNSQLAQQKRIVQEGILKQRGAIAKEQEGLFHMLADANQPMKASDAVQNIRLAARSLAPDFIEPTKKALATFASRNGIPIDARALKLIDDFHKTSEFSSLSEFAKKSGNPILHKVAQVWDWATDKVRENMLTRSFANNGINMMNDTLQMMTAGVNNPVSALSEAAKVLANDPKFKLTFGGMQLDGPALKRLANRYNIGLENVTKRTVENALGPLAEGHKLRVVKDIVTGGAFEHLPDKIAQYIPATFQHQHKWEDLAKVGLFLERLKRGDGPYQAAKVTFDTLLDYADRSRILQVIKWVAPFFTWMYKMPAAVGRAAIRNPSSVMRPYKFASAFEGDKQIEPPAYRLDSGSVSPLTPRGEEVLKNFAGTPNENIGQTYMRRRFPFDEALAPYVSAVSGDLKPLVLNSLGVGPRFIAGSSLGVDTLTGKPKTSDLGTEALNLLPSLFISRPMQEVYNKLLYEAGGGAKEGMPVAPLNEYSRASYNPEQKALERWLSTIGITTFKAAPTDAIRNRLESEVPKKLLESVKELKDTTKKVKAAKKHMENVR